MCLMEKYYINHMFKMKDGNLNGKSDGQISGTVGIGKRLEAIQIKLNGNVSKKYNVYYRVHVQDYGWLDWAKNGESAGTIGLSKRIEAIEVKLVKKGENAPGATNRPCVEPKLEYSHTYSRLRMARFKIRW